MAPSRGSNALQLIRGQIFRPLTQVYISKSLDPYLNLSIEHYLLQKTPAESTILFLYTNRPCIVIGRNQNPWVEVNLGLLNKGELKVDLVRRRSGGGTVFHDEGNVNYSVICPSSAFDRDRHAQMVVRALQNAGVTRAKVNERHDIVVDRLVGGLDRRFKVSGSAYKLTRLRSLHHGTCLLSSPNLPNISQYLRSPAKQFIKARGVESVSSPITNTRVDNDEFKRGVVSEFEAMYGSSHTAVVGELEQATPEVATGLKELKSRDWIYCQTPQFTFYSNGLENDSASARPNLFSDELVIEFTARHGVISEAQLSGAGMQPDERQSIATKLNDQRLDGISDWHCILPSRGKYPTTRPGLLSNTLRETESMSPDGCRMSLPCHYLITACNRLRNILKLLTTNWGIMERRARDEESCYRGIVKELKSTSDAEMGMSMVN